MLRPLISGTIRPDSGNFSNRSTAPNSSMARS
jgi:hypothetical protein